jgi:hypothetical protein
LRFAAILADAEQGGLDLQTQPLSLCIVGTKLSEGRSIG